MKITNCECGNRNAPVGEICGNINNEGETCDLVNLDKITPLIRINLEFLNQSPNTYFSKLLPKYDSKQDEFNEIVFDYEEDTNNSDLPDSLNAIFHQLGKNLYLYKDSSQNSLLEDAASPKLEQVLLNEELPDGAQSLTFSVIYSSACFPDDYFAWAVKEIIRDIENSANLIIDGKKLKPSKIDGEELSIKSGLI
jgi:hypothetical protein